ncbi:MAG: BNR-4 repeat-containing protein, partial [Verrucomicrobiota bacterium]
MILRRRQFLATTSSGLLGLNSTSSLLATKMDPGPPFLLSSVGCGRATGYAEANRIVTLDDRTHVAWLDSPAEGFRVRVRTLDRTKGSWSRTRTVGQGYDNHGGPALSIDREGYLHIVYFPHHHPFRYRRSKFPNDASEWEEEIQFGDQLTYPTLVCGPDNTLYFTARRSSREKPWEVEFWSKKPGEDWSCHGPILRSRYSGYAHFQESLTWDSDHRALHLCCRFHEDSDRDAYGRLQNVAYMKTEDFGETWQRSGGTMIPTPASVDDIEIVARGGVDRVVELRAGCLAVDPKTGLPHLIYSVTEYGRARSIVAISNGEGDWDHEELSAQLPEELQGRNLIMPGGLSFSETGKLHGVAQIQ